MPRKQSTKSVNYLLNAPPVGEVVPAAAEGAAAAAAAAASGAPPVGGALPIGEEDAVADYPQDIQAGEEHHEDEAELQDEGITEHARLLRRLTEHEAEIRNLQAQREQLAQQIAARNRVAATQEAVRQAEATKARLEREINFLRAPPGHNEAVIVLDDIADAREAEAVDPTSPLSAELQRHPWPPGYKPRIPVFNGKSNPAKFIASYEAAVHSAGGDSTTLAKSLIMAVEEVAHDWYMSLRPLSIRSWRQAKNELLVTFQGFQTDKKTARDLLKLNQPDDEPLSKYLERLIQLRVQVPNVPDEMIIAVAIEGLKLGPCAEKLTREVPVTVKELFDEMRKFARSEDDLQRRKASEEWKSISPDSP